MKDADAREIHKVLARLGHTFQCLAVKKKNHDSCCLMCQIQDTKSGFVTELHILTAGLPKDTYRAITLAHLIWLPVIKISTNTQISTIIVDN